MSRPALPALTPCETRRGLDLHDAARARAQALRREAMGQAWTTVGQALAAAGRAANRAACRLAPPPLHPPIPPGVAMPMLTVLLATAPSSPLAAEVAADLLDLTTTHLGKRADLTAIAVQFVDPAHWFIGGQTLARQGRHAAFVEARVTDETNTQADKARYIAAVFAALARRLGPLHDTSYVQVQDLRAAAWGWGGRTQAARAHAPALSDCAGPPAAVSA